MDYQESDGDRRLSQEAKQWLDDVARLDEYCRSLPDTYAGRWNDGGISVAVAFTDEIELHVEALHRLLHAPERVRVVRLRFSRRHLLELRDRIPSILGATSGIADWGLNDKSNCVIVHARPAHLDQVRAILEATNPDDVLVVPGGPAIPTET